MHALCYTDVQYTYNKKIENTKQHENQSFGVERPLRVYPTLTLFQKSPVPHLGSNFVLFWKQRYSLHISIYTDQRLGYWFNEHEVGD